MRRYEIWCWWSPLASWLCVSYLLRCHGDQSRDSGEGNIKLVSRPSPRRGGCREARGGQGRPGREPLLVTAMIKQVQGTPGSVHTRHSLSPPLLPFPIPQWTHHSIWPIRGKDIVRMTNQKLTIVSPSLSLMTRTGLGRILPHFPRLQAGSCGAICGQKRGPGHRTQPGVIPGLWLVRTHPSHQHHLAAIFTERGQLR